MGVPQSYSDSMVERNLEGHAMKDFAKATHRNLNTKGIWVIRTTVLPGDGKLPMASGKRGYVIVDNDTQRIWTHAQVMAAAA